MESLEGSVYKIGITEAKTRFLWMTMVSSKKVDGLLDQWLKDNNWLKGVKFQTDNGEFNSKACKNLIDASGGKHYQLSLLTRNDVHY